MHEIDGCVDVSDTFAAFPGTVSTIDKPPTTFTSTQQVDPHHPCGVDTVENTAPFLTNDRNGRRTRP